MALKKFGCEVLFIIINVYYRPHWRNHHGGQRAPGRLPPWTSPASWQPTLHATSREQQEAAAELLTVLSASAGCERHCMSGEWDQWRMTGCALAVWCVYASVVIRVVLVYLVSERFPTLPGTNVGNTQRVFASGVGWRGPSFGRLVQKQAATNTEKV